MEVWTKTVVVKVKRVIGIQIYFRGKVDSTCLDIVMDGGVVSDEENWVIKDDSSIFGLRN